MKHIKLIIENDGKGLKFTKCNVLNLQSVLFALYKSVVCEEADGGIRAGLMHHINGKQVLRVYQARQAR